MRTGRPRDWAVRNVEILEDVWAFEVSSLGYRAPATDGVRGGTVSSTSTSPRSGTRGTTAIARPRTMSKSGRVGGVCLLRLGQGLRWTSWAAAEDNLKVTAAHEFFHAIQYNYDFAEDKWLMEATATWMEERYADSVNDNRQYLRYGQMGKPGDTAGHVQWAHPLRQLALLRETDQEVRRGRGAQHLEPAGRQHRRARPILHPGSEELPGVTRNQSAQVLRPLRRGNLAPGRAYTEGWAYKATKFANKFRFKSGHKSIAPHQAKLRHLTSKSYRFKPANSLPGKAKLKFKIDGPAKSDRTGSRRIDLFQERQAHQEVHQTEQVRGRIRQDEVLAAERSRRSR